MKNLIIIIWVLFAILLALFLVNIGKKSIPIIKEKYINAFKTAKYTLINHKKSIINGNSYFYRSDDFVNVGDTIGFKNDVLCVIKKSSKQLNKYKGNDHE